MGSNLDTIDTFEKQTIKTTLTGTKEKWIKKRTKRRLEAPRKINTEKTKSKNVTNLYHLTRQLEYLELNRRSFMNVRRNNTPVYDDFLILQDIKQRKRFSGENLMENVLCLFALNDKIRVFA